MTISVRPNRITLNAAINACAQGIVADLTLEANLQFHKVWGLGFQEQA